MWNNNWLGCLDNLLDFWSLNDWLLCLLNLLNDFFWNSLQSNWSSNLWDRLFLNNITEIHLTEHNLGQLLSIDISLFNFINKLFSLLNRFLLSSSPSLDFVLSNQLSLLISFFLQFLSLPRHLNLLLLLFFFFHFHLDFFEDAFLFGGGELIGLKSQELIEVWFVDWHGTSHMLVASMMLMPVLMTSSSCSREQKG